MLLGVDQVPRVVFFPQDVDSGHGGSIVGIVCGQITLCLNNSTEEGRLFHNLTMEKDEFQIKSALLFYWTVRASIKDQARGGM